MFSQPTHEIIYCLHECFGALFLREVTTLGDDDQVGVGQLVGQADAVSSRDDPVVVAGDDEHGLLDFAQPPAQSQGPAGSHQLP